MEFNSAAKFHGHSVIGGISALCVEICNNATNEASLLDAYPGNL